MRANLLAASSPKKLAGEVVNIAGGRRIGLNELCREIGRVMGHEVAIDHVAPRPGDIRHSLADITAARELLGYEPLVRWEDGLPPTLAYLRALRAEGPSAASRTLTSARVRVAQGASGDGGRAATQVMRSMTGFGVGDVALPEGRVVAEIRSVNQRFLDVRARAPRELSDLSLFAEQIAREQLRRGRVELLVHTEGVVLSPCTLDKARARAALSALASSGTSSAPAPTCRSRCSRWCPISSPRPPGPSSPRSGAR